MSPQDKLIFVLKINGHSELTDSLEDTIGEAVSGDGLLFARGGQVFLEIECTVHEVLARYDDARRALEAVGVGVASLDVRPLSEEQGSPVGTAVVRFPSSYPVRRPTTADRSDFRTGL